MTATRPEPEMHADLHAALPGTCPGCADVTAEVDALSLEQEKVFERALEEGATVRTALIIATIKPPADAAGPAAPARCCDGLR